MDQNISYVHNIKYPNRWQIIDDVKYPLRNDAILYPTKFIQIDADPLDGKPWILCCGVLTRDEATAESNRPVYQHEDP